MIDQLTAAGIRVWVDGGWGVDALVGRQTRHHDDLADLADAWENRDCAITHEQLLELLEDKLATSTTRSWS